MAFGSAAWFDRAPVVARFLELGRLNAHGVNADGKNQISSRHRTHRLVCGERLDRDASIEGSCFRDR